MNDNKKTNRKGTATFVWNIFKYMIVLLLPISFGVETGDAVAGASGRNEWHIYVSVLPKLLMYNLWLIIICFFWLHAVSCMYQVFFDVRVEWRNWTPYFIFLPKRENQNNSLSRLGIDLAAFALTIIRCADRIFFSF